jgi:putative peptide zinc metalloprotease protein
MSPAVPGQTDEELVMSIAAIDRSAAAAPAHLPAPGATESAPQLLDGTELIGRLAGSGLREPPYLVRRCDGQVVQVSQLLYVMPARWTGARSPRSPPTPAKTWICESPPTRSHTRPNRSSLHWARSPPTTAAPRNLERINALLALRFRAGERAVNALANVLRPLFLPPVVIAALAALAALAACDIWLASSHGIGAGLRTAIHHPTLGLALFALTILSLALHECGHAAACR